jgi:stage II sporulation protein AB (anti-sigma F factor)
MADLTNHGLTTSYRAVAACVGVARRELSEFAWAAGADPEQVDAVRLASSEALTNAVLHAYGDQPEPGQIQVTAAVVAEELWILIADDGCGLAPRPDRPGLGLGLALIAQLSDEFAVCTRAGGGVEVRMRFDLTGPRRPARAAPRRGLTTRSTSTALGLGIVTTRRGSARTR